MGKNTVNERERTIQVMLHIVNELSALWETKSDVLQCHVHNPPISQNITENLSSTPDLGLIFIANTGVLFHSLLSQSDLDRGQPTVGSGREVRENEYSGGGDKDRQSTLGEE